MNSFSRFSGNELKLLPPKIKNAQNSIPPSHIYRVLNIYMLTDNIAAMSVQLKCIAPDSYKIKSLYVISVHLTSAHNGSGTCGDEMFFHQPTYSIYLFIQLTHMLFHSL